MASFPRPTYYASNVPTPWSAPARPRVSLLAKCDLRLQRPTRSVAGGRPTGYECSAERARRTGRASPERKYHDGVHVSVVVAIVFDIEIVLATLLLILLLCLPTVSCLEDCPA